jgi:hypothetical protein
MTIDIKMVKDSHAMVYEESFENVALFIVHLRRS